MSETAAHVAHGRIVHITMAGVPVFSRDDVAFIPIQDLAPAALGLIWKTVRHSAKIRARRRRLGTGAAPSHLLDRRRSSPGRRDVWP